MSEKLFLKYLDNPEQYCESITTLIQDGADEWQTVWKAAIPELFQNSNLSQSPSNNINAINTLLKVIEKAFKERVYRIRVQAFECWQYFIMVVENYVVSDKLLNVLLIPLCASNHSIHEVLLAKLKTFGTLLDSNLILKPIIMRKAVPNLLKLLYGPHNLRPAAEFDDLIEVSGMIYLKVIEKCMSLEIGEVISSYLERAIPTLNKDENTRPITKQIWCSALEHMCRNNWPPVQFNHLMKTFENLISCNNQSGYVLVSELLSTLIEEYSTFPARFAMLHVRLLTRCLFYSITNEQMNKCMDCLLKKYKNECLFFSEIGQTLDDFADEYKDKFHKHWIVATNFFLKWIKSNPVSEDSDWILLLPVKHMHAEWSSSIESQIQKYHDELCSAVNGNVLIKNLLQKLCTFLDESENVPVSLLNASIALCKVILKNSKYSVFRDGICTMRFLLKTVNKKMPSQNLTDPAYKSFIPKFVATVLFYIDNYSDYASEFTSIIQNYSQCMKDDKTDKDELSVIQVISKYTSLKSADESNDAVLRLSNGINVPLDNKTATPGKLKRGSFLARLSPVVGKRQTNLRSPRSARSTETPKSQKSSVTDDEVQFIAVKTKPKNSPMTEHQKEKAKSKSYIPPLYEDLSQSQSQSQSLIESTLSLENDEVKAISGVEYFEENANLPTTTNNSEKNDHIPATISFRNYPTYSSNVDKPSHVFSSKKSLFNDSPKKTDQKTKNIINVNVQMIPEHPAIENILIEEKTQVSISDSSIKDKQGMKRRSVRMEYKTPPTPIKRSKQTPKNGQKPQNINESVPKKGRGRPRSHVPVNEAMKSPEMMNVEVINLTDTESQNLFVPQTPDKESKSSFTMSSPLPSLMNVKNSDNCAKTRRKSLKSKNNNRPVRSPISTRKRKSLANENLDNKKIFTPFVDESYLEMTVNADDTKLKIKSAVPAKNVTSVCTTGKDGIRQTNSPENITSPENNENTIAVPINLSPVKKDVRRNFPTKEVKETDATASPDKSVILSEDVTPAKTDENSKNTDAEGEAVNHIIENLSADTNNSVVIIENNSTAEVISIMDSESQSAIRDESTQSKLTQTSESQVFGEKDESTYFENAEVQETRNATEVVCHNGDESNKKCDNGIDKEQLIEAVILESSSVTDSGNKSFPEELIIKKSFCENPVNPNSVCDTSCVESNANMSRNEADDLNGNSGINKSVTNNDEITDVSELIDILSDPIESSLRNETVNNKKDKTPSPEKPGDLMTTKNNEISGVFDGKKKSTNQIADKNEGQQTDEDESKVNTSPISNNTRTIKIMRLVYDSQNVTKPKNSTKVSKSPMASNGLGVSNFKATSTNQRSMKMLMANGNLDKSRSSPNKIITTPTERLKYVPKECTSPGILKKPDLNGSISSPKSAKFVNFAEHLTDTRTFDVDEENYFDDSEDRPSNNLLSDEEGMSQDVLYSPLLNCRDDVKNITDRLSLSKQALDLFHRMGIETVGQLASVSTITAKSIPAGDNRLQRLRKALQEYDEYRVSIYTSKGLRTPSARRRILYKSQENKMDVSSIVQLMCDVETVDETETQKTNKNCELDSERCGAKTSLPTVEIRKLDDEFCAAKVARPLADIEKLDVGVGAAKIAHPVVTIEKLDVDVSSTKISRPIVEIEKLDMEVCGAETSMPTVDMTKPDVIKTCLPNVEIQKLDNELCAGKTRLPAIEIEKLDDEFCANIINKNRSPTKNPEKGMSPTKSFEGNIGVTSEAISVLLESAGSEGNPDTEISDREQASCMIIDNEAQPTKVNDDTAQAMTNDDNIAEPPKNDSVDETNASIIDEQSSAVENIITELINDVETSAAKKRPIIADVEMENDFPNGTGIAYESQNDMSDDSDFICTSNNDIESKSRNLRSYSRLVSARVSMTSFHNSTPRRPTLSQNMTPSPEIITIDLDACDEHEELDKETSVSIFSPNMNGRSENDGEDGNNDKEQDDRPRLTFDSLKDVSMEGLSPGIENIFRKIGEEERQHEETQGNHMDTRTGNVLQELMFNILNPYLSMSCLKDLISNEEIARNKLLELINTLKASIEKHNLPDSIKTELSILGNITNRRSE